MFSNTITRVKWFITTSTTYSCFKRTRIASKSHISHNANFINNLEDTKNDIINAL